MPNSRIQYVEGSSLPHFEGDKSTMTLQEARELIMRRDVHRVAEAIVPHVAEKLTDQAFFDGASEYAIQAARRILGNDRPLHDDDQVYFQLVDLIYHQAARALISAMQDALRNL
jgi:hypothetical protein